MRLKVFVSSTCYDLGIIRSQLRSFIEGMGYEPVMSEYNDVLYDPSDHTHTGCMEEVQHADLVILIIGARYGGTAIPPVKEMLDFPKLANLSRNKDILNEKNKLSITQCEVLKAVSEEIPIYTFIQSDVYHDHLVYVKNTINVDVANSIIYPSIDKGKIETAVYIFEFINYLRGLSKNNAIYPFVRFDDITNTLRSQWSGLFQSLLAKRHEETRHKGLEELAGQIEDMKAMLMTSMNSSFERKDLEETAEGVVEYRKMISTMSTFAQQDLLNKDIPWSELKKECQIKGEGVINMSGRRRKVVEMEDGTFYYSRLLFDSIDVLKPNWEEFRKIKAEKKKAIVRAIVKTSNGPLSRFVHVDMPIDEYIAQSAVDD